MVMVASVIGYYRCKNRSDKFTVRHCGYVGQKAHEDGFYLSMRTGFGAFYPECVGGGRTIELAAEIVREKCWYPSVRVCEMDGTIERV